MKAKIDFKPTPLPARPGLLTFLNQMPSFTGLGSNITGAGSSLTKLGVVNGTFVNAEATAKTLGSGFRFAGMGLAIVDFFRIPAIYIAAWQLGVKIPANRNRNLSWIYASLLLASSFVALAIPATAPIIALCTATLGLAVSLFSFGRYFYIKHKVAKALDTVSVDLAKAEAALDVLQQEVLVQEQHLTAAVGLGDHEKTQQLIAVIDTLHQRFNTQKDEIQTLHDRKFKLEHKLLQQGMGRFMDKTVGVGLASLSLIGLTLSMFFPPLGVTLLAVSACLGLTYTVGRMVAPSVVAYFQARAKAAAAQEAYIELTDEESSTLTKTLDVANPSQVQSLELVDQSTITITCKLGSPSGYKPLADSPVASFPSVLAHMPRKHAYAPEHSVDAVMNLSAQI